MLVMVVGPTAESETWEESKRNNEQEASDREMLTRQGGWGEDLAWAANAYPHIRFRGGSGWGFACSSARVLDR